MKNNKLELEQIVVNDNIIYIPRKGRIKNITFSYKYKTEPYEISLDKVLPPGTQTLKNIKNYAESVNSFISNLEKIGFPQKFLTSGIELTANKDILFEYQPFFIPEFVDSELKKVYGNKSSEDDRNYLKSSRGIQILVDFKNIDFNKGHIKFLRIDGQGIFHNPKIEFEASRDLSSVDYLKESDDYIIKTTPKNLRSRKY